VLVLHLLLLLVRHTYPLHKCCPKKRATNKAAQHMAFQEKPRAVLCESESVRLRTAHRMCAATQFAWQCLLLEPAGKGRT
jgi:hypothetical protein